MTLRVFNDGLTAMIVLFVLCLLIGFGFILYKLIIREKKLFDDEVSNYMDGVETKNDIIADIKSNISKSISEDFPLFYCDFDKFSNLVDNYGKEESERILKEILRKIIKALPPRYRIGRLKGDCFIILSKDEQSREDVIDFSKTILDIVSEPVRLYDDSTISLTMSIGICYYPVHGRDYHELLKSLEIACYMCKRNGGNQYAIYSNDTDENAANPEYYAQIKSGIKNKEFDLYFQPMIDLKSNEIYAIEGLLRWNHPELGLLSPHKFISIMEQTGDINWVGLWGFETLVKKYVELRKIYNGNFKFSLNLSPKQLSNPNLAIEFQKIVRKYRLQTNNFILEIEEFTIFERQDQIKITLNQLSNLGFEIAIDGFGLDYNSLKKLETNPINVVKLDRETLRDEPDYLKKKFIEMLVEFASLNNRVLVCEGIEDESFLRRAKKLDISVLQGYLYAKPMSSSDLDSYIINGTWKEINNIKVQDQTIVKEILVDEEPTIDDMVKEDNIIKMEEKVKKTSSKKKKVEESNAVLDDSQEKSSEVANTVEEDSNIGSSDESKKEASSTDEVELDEEKNNIETEENEEK